MRSSKSGGSKTRMAVADICGLCVDKYWDNQAEDFVENLNYQGPGFLFIQNLILAEKCSLCFWPL